MLTSWLIYIEKRDILEVKLISECNLEYAVLVLCTISVKYLSYTKVVTTIKNEVLILVRYAYRDREVYTISLKKFVTVYRNTICRILVINLETRLQAELNGKALSNVHVGKERYVDIIELYSSVFNLASLHRIESAKAYTNNVSYLILKLSTCCQTNASIRLILICKVGDVHTNLRLQCKRTNCVLCIRCNRSEHYYCCEN